MAVRVDCRSYVEVTGSKALRPALALVALVATGAFAAAAGAATRTETSVPTLNRSVLHAINSFRRAHHLHVLSESPQLARSARQHSLQMGRLGYFAHPSANGTAFWRRIERYFRSGRYAYWSVGENLLWASPSVSATQAMKMWIASPEHLRNLLTPEWRYLGVAAVHVVDAPGVFGGQAVTIITTDFGARRR